MIFENFLFIIFFEFEFKLRAYLVHHKWNGTELKIQKERNGTWFLEILRLVQLWNEIKFFLIFFYINIDYVLIKYKNMLNSTALPCSPQKSWIIIQCWRPWWGYKHSRSL